MKIILIACAAILLAAVAWFFLGHAGPDHHGQPFRGLPAVELARIAGNPGDYVKKEVRIEGPITRQCPSSGCWFFLREPGGKELKVEMGETTPRLPARIGRTAIVEGQVIRFGDAYEFIGTAVEFR